MTDLPHGIDYLREVLKEHGCRTADSVKENFKPDMTSMLCCWGRDDLIDNGTIVFSSAAPLQPPFPANGVITIQSEYLILEEIILNQYALDHATPISIRRQHGALVTGMPGIGKSVFLLYLLAKALAREEPVCIYVQMRVFVILGPKLSDVYIVPDSSPVFDCKALYDLLFLIDMDWRFIPNNPGFMTTSNVFYQVVAPSPNPQLYDRLRGWQKELCIATVVMNPPHVADIVKIFEHAYPQSGLTEPQMQDFIRRMFDLFHVDLRRFQVVFSNVAFQTNRFEVLREEVNQFVDEVQAVLLPMSPQDVISLIRGGAGGLPQFSHRLIATYRKTPGAGLLQARRYGHMRYEIRSSLVVKLICAAWPHQDDKLQTVMEGMLLSNMKMTPSLGWFPKAEAHSHILTNPSLTIYPVARTQVGQNICLRHDSNLHSQSMEIRVGPRVMRLYDSASSMTCERDAYYIPMQANNPLFDSFLASEDFGMAFQLTTSRTHTFKTEYLKLLQERFKAICGKPPSSSMFVFIIPMGRNLRIGLPDGPTTRMFQYYILPSAFKSLELQDPASVKHMLDQNGIDGTLADVEPDDSHNEDDRDIDMY